MILSINNKDYSENVIADGTYDVSEENVTKEWTDGNYITHSQVIRKRVNGSFSMVFKHMDEYEAFLADIEAVRDPRTNMVDMSVAINKPVIAVRTISGSIDFRPTRAIVGNKEIIRSFRVSVRQK